MPRTRSAVRLQELLAVFAVTREQPDEMHGSLRSEVLLRLEHAAKFPSGPTDIDAAAANIEQVQDVLYPHLKDHDSQSKQLEDNVHRIDDIETVLVDAVSVHAFAQGPT